MSVAMPTGRPPAAHERDAVATRRIVLALALFVAVIGVCAVVSLGLLRALGGARDDSTAVAHADPRAGFALPRLQSAPALDLARYRAEKRALLTSYRWIDRAHGVVGIPIERAMALVAERAAAAGHAR
jgi:hypothetical protein